jgi:putative PIN family toxin of toxin-antitoxin system
VIRAVIDTNVYISALFGGGAPRRVVDLAAAGRFQALTSPELLTELEDVLADDFGVPQERLDLVVRDVLSYAVVVTPDEETPSVVRDPADAKVIACALAGGADFIVTGDADLLTLGEVERVRVVTVRRFLSSRRW